MNLDNVTKNDIISARESQKKYSEINDYYKDLVDDFYEFEERAAIMEFDGGLTPSEAARQAFMEISFNQ